MYFPDGPPLYSVDLGSDMLSWSGQTINIAADITDNSGTTPTYEWDVEPLTGVTLIPADDKAAVTIDKPEGAPVTYTLSLTVGNGAMTDKMTIEVYDNACLATRLGLGITEKVDLTGDCVINMEDLARIASNWLNDKSLLAPVRKSE